MADRAVVEAAVKEQSFVVSCMGETVRLRVRREFACQGVNASAKGLVRKRVARKVGGARLRREGREEGELRGEGKSLRRGGREEGELWGKGKSTRNMFEEGMKLMLAKRRLFLMMDMDLRHTK